MEKNFDDVSLQDNDEKQHKSNQSVISELSHDMRLALNGLLGALDMLLISNPSLKSNSIFPYINSSANNVTSLLNQILVVEKYGINAIKPELEIFNIRKFIQEIVSSMQYQYKDSVAVKHFISEFIPVTLEGDASSLRRVLHNLLSNALKSTDNGSVKLTLNVHSKLEDKLLIKFMISDTGVGLPPGVGENLLDKFSRFGQFEEGFGVGLAIVKKLLANMGSAIKFNNNSAGGADFHFILSLKKAENKVLNNSFYSNYNSQNTIQLKDDEYLCFSELTWFLCNTLHHGYVNYENSIPNNLKVYDISLFESDIRMDNPFFKPKIIILKDDGHLLERLQRIITKVIVQSDNKLMLVLLSDKSEEERRLLSASGIDLFLPNNSPYSNIVPKVNEYWDIWVKRQKKELEFSKNLVLNILLIEDDKISQMVVKSLLEKFKCKVTTASSSKETLEVLSSHAHFDLILMDLGLPDGNGIDLTHNIKSKSLAPDSIIFALTAHSLKEEQLKAIRVGMHGFIVKPMSIESLKIALDVTISKICSKQSIAQSNF